MTIVHKSTFGRNFCVVEPAAVAPELARHTLGSFDDHEPVLERWCRGIKPGDVVVDVGACFGSYTLPALAAGATVHAYEPFDDGYRILLANIAANGWGHRCTVRKACLWDGTEYPTELGRQVFGHHYPSEQFETVCLDDEGIGRVDWLKSDVEGAELGLLLGARATLERWRPTLLIEDHEGVSPDPNDEVSRYPERIGSRARIRAMLVGLGYELHHVPWDVSRMYVVATHPDRS